MKAKIRNIVILIGLAVTGVLVLQTSWLINNYKISREKARIEIKGILDNAVREHNEKKATQVKGLIKQLIKSDKDFNYHILHWPREIGVHNTGIQLAIAAKGDDPKRFAYAVYPIPPADTTAVKKDPYGYFIKWVNTFTLDNFKSLYSALAYETRYSKDKKSPVEIQLKQLYEQHVDSVLLRKIVEKDFLNVGMEFKGTVRFYKNLGSYGTPVNKFKLIPFDERVQIVFESPNSFTLPQQLNNMHRYMDSLNNKSDSLYIETYTQQLEGDILSYSAPGIIMVVKPPLMLIIRQMIVSIIGSAILLLFLGACMIYMFYLILQQKKLADIKNDFISNISHELKTPIATTLAAVQGMQYFDVLKDDEKTARYLATASDELQRLTTMVNKILNISIFESADFTLNPVQFNLKELLQSIISGQQIRQEKPISFTLNYTTDENIFADKTHLHNVMINLIDNAIKYSKDQVNISIICTNAPDGIELRVQDDGPGIAPEFQKNIFDKFFRVPNPNDHSVKGYGLGLNYVKHIIEKHGGTVALKSDASGSTFIISLPQHG